MSKRFQEWNVVSLVKWLCIFHAVLSGQELEGQNGDEEYTCDPEFAERIFGEEGTIYGYVGLKVSRHVMIPIVVRTRIAIMEKRSLVRCPLVSLDAISEDAASNIVMFVSSRQGLSILIWLSHADWFMVARCNTACIRSDTIHFKGLCLSPFGLTFPFYAEVFAAGPLIIRRHCVHRSKWFFAAFFWLWLPDSFGLRPPPVGGEASQVF